MLFVSAKEVREGMCVAQDVCDDQGRILIARGQRVAQHHIVRLRKFQISSIFIDPNNGESAPPPAKSELREQCEKVLSSACSQLKQEFAAKRINLDVKAIQSATEHLLEALLRSKNPLVTLVDLDTGSDRLMQHSVNTTVLATILGIDLHIPPAMIKDLAVAMLFHDIGTIFLPESLTQRTGPLTAQEVQLLRKHPQVGFEHLVRSDALTSVAANVVLRHHETLDGTGYPQGMGGDKLSGLMRIANVVETYDALTSPRFGIQPVLPDAALTYILANTGKLFAKEVVVALSKHIALYPKGSAVQLNTGEVGVVAGVLPTAPTRPVILLHYDNKGKQLKTPLIVDLTNDPGRSVARSAQTLPQLVQAKDQPVAPRHIDPILAGLG